jgi:small subunit ribosomal protein S17
MAKEQKQSVRRRLIGVVVSDKMAKTVVVQVDRTVMHAKYQKRFSVSKTYKAHDETGIAHTDDQVEIEETRPMSGGKRWRVIAKLK